MADENPANPFTELSKIYFNVQEAREGLEAMTEEVNKLKSGIERLRELDEERQALIREMTAIAERVKDVYDVR